MICVRELNIFRTGTITYPLYPISINPIELWSRKNCKTVNGKHKKIVTAQWLSRYDKIIIIDDSPNVWLTQDEKIIFLVPDEFRGDVKDFGLEKIINELKQL